MNFGYPNGKYVRDRKYKFIRFIIFYKIFKY